MKYLRKSMLLLVILQLYTLSVVYAFQYYFNTEKQQVNVGLVLSLPPTSIVNATVDINPQALNPRSGGKWIITYIEFPEGYNVSDIDVSSILLNDTVSVDLSAPIAIGDYDNDTVPDLMVCFNWTEVTDYILSKGIVFGNVTLEVSGKLYTNTVFT